MSEPTPASPAPGAAADVVAEVRALLVRIDELIKAAPSRPEPAAAQEPIQRLIDEARTLVAHVDDARERAALAGGISRRVDDADLVGLGAMLAASPDVARAPTTVDDPARIPPGQHLTPGFPVLHVGSAPDWAPSDVRVVVTGLVEHRQVLDLAALRALGSVALTRDFHCVTRWSRLDNRWTGVRLREVIDLAGAGATASHVLVSGHPAYSANLTLEVARADDVLLAWDHDGAPLAPAHGGPLRLVVPALYGWKSVKWVTEVRLLDHDVPGYWEERGYHDVGDPWAEQRFQDGHEG